MRYDLRHGDCLELMKDIPNGSVDMILCDLPYGTTACKWDVVIPFEPLWEQYERIIKDNGVIALTASQPFTSVLVMSNLRMFKYELIWDKKKGTAPGVAKYRPMPAHESVLIFGKAKTTYNPQMVEGKPYNDIRNNERRRNQDDGHKLGYTGIIEIKNDGFRYPLSVIEHPHTQIPNSLHPTQKPVGLMEWLIKSYTNEGDTVLDNCMGSASTGEACINTGRFFIGIEKDENYYEVAHKRLSELLTKEAKGSVGKKNINTNGLLFNEDNQQVLHKAHVMRWVDIEIQKPEYMQCCLITNQWGSVTEAQYTGESNIFSVGEDEYRATAWMELPPPFA